MIPAIIAGGAALMGGAMSASSDSKNTYRTNEQNMKIAQMNNEWSERMMEKQNRYNIDQWMRESNFSAQQADKANQFTLDMWNRSNAYNSASAQRARYEAAGLNPYMMMNGGSAGVAQGASGAQASTPSGNSVGLPSPSTATMIKPTFGGIGKAVSDAAAAFAQVQNSSAQSDYYSAQSDYYRAQAISTMANTYEDIRNKKFQNELNEATESIQYAMKNEQYLSAVQQRVNAGMTEKLMMQQEVMNKLQIANLPDQMKWDIAVKKSTVNLNEFNASSDLGKYLKTLEEKYNVKLTRDEIRAIFEAWKVDNMTNAPKSPWELFGRAVTMPRYWGTKW